MSQAASGELAAECELPSEAAVSIAESKHRNRVPQRLEMNVGLGSFLSPNGQDDQKNRNASYNGTASESVLHLA